MSAKVLNRILLGFMLILSLFIFVSLMQSSSKLKSKSNSLIKLKAEEAATKSKQSQINEDIKGIKQYSDLNNIAKTIVPQDKDQAETVREIVNIANQSGISKIDSITFPSSSLGASSGKSAHGITQVTPVKGLSGIYDLQITVTQGTTDEIHYSNFINFLSKLENNRRTAVVDSITINPDPNNPDLVAFTLSLDEYIKP